MSKFNDSCDYDEEVSTHTTGKNLEKAKHCKFTKLSCISHMLVYNTFIIPTADPYFFA